MKDKHLVPNIVQMYEYGPSVLALQSSSQDLPSFPPVVPKHFILVRIHYTLYYVSPWARLDPPAAVLVLVPGAPRHVSVSG